MLSKLTIQTVFVPGTKTTFDCFATDTHEKCTLDWTFHIEYNIYPALTRAHIKYIAKCMAINCKPLSTRMCFSLIQFVMHYITGIESVPCIMQWPGLWDEIHDGFKLIFACQQTMWLMIIHWPCTISYEANAKKKREKRKSAYSVMQSDRSSNLQFIHFRSKSDCECRSRVSRVYINGKIPIEIAISHILSRKFVSVNCQGNSVRSRAYDIDCIKLFWSKTIEHCFCN